MDRYIAPIDLDSPAHPSFLRSLGLVSAGMSQFGLLQNRQTFGMGAFGCHSRPQRRHLRTRTLIVIVRILEFNLHFQKKYSKKNLALFLHLW